MCREMLRLWAPVYTAETDSEELCHMLQRGKRFRHLTLRELLLRMKTEKTNKMQQLHVYY
jgi:hypothetical protein